LEANTVPNLAIIIFLIYPTHRPNMLLRLTYNKSCEIGAYLALTAINSATRETTTNVVTTTKVVAVTDELR